MTDTQTPKAAGSGYDADAKADARSSAPVTIGGETFHLRRRVWPVAIEIRRVIRAQERVASRILRIQRELERLADREPIRMEGETDELFQARVAAAPKPNPGETLEDFEARIAEREDELESQTDELVEQSDDLAYRLVAVGLHKTGESADTHADVDFLKANLAADEAGELARKVGRGEDPTPPAAPATTEA